MLASFCWQSQGYGKGGALGFGLLQGERLCSGTVPQVCPLALWVCSDRVGVVSPAQALWTHPCTADKEGWHIPRREGLPGHSRAPCHCIALAVLFPAEVTTACAMPARASRAREAVGSLLSTRELTPGHCVQFRPLPLFNHPSIPRDAGWSSQAGQGWG